jgi:ATP-binding cassette subfamily F protein 3
VLAALSGLELAYGGKVVLSGLDLELKEGSRLALVGRNGSGKSSLLRLLAGHLTPTAGRRFLAPGVAVGYLEQDPSFAPDATVLSVVDAAFQELDAIEAQLTHLRAQALSSPEELVACAALEEHYARRGGYLRRSRRDAALSAFGFAGREAEPAAALSGGERTRLSLAALLVRQPDLLLLDEPTNHLDVTRCEWLEDFLFRSGSAQLIVSHDRRFLDHLAQEVLYLSGGRLERYAGNYSQFREQRRHQLELAEARRRQERREISRLEESTQRLKVWGLGNAKLARRARSLESRLQRLWAVPEAPAELEQPARTLKFLEEGCGELVVEARWLSAQVSGRWLYRDLQLHLRRGQRVALIGENGAGKTTLACQILGLFPAGDPRQQVRFGPRVRLGYYDQQLSGVSGDQTPFVLIRSGVESDQAAHDLLATFGFAFDRHGAPVASLSGGERARLALLRLARQPTNFLVLDEPSNHLDAETLEVLEAALSVYQGAVLLISHDRALIDGVAQELWHLGGGQFERYLGNYRQWAALQVAPVQVPPGRSPEARPPRGPGLWHLKRRLEQLEAEVAALEAELAEARGLLEGPPPELDFAAAGQRVADLEEQLARALEAWSALAEQVELAGQ